MKKYDYLIVGAGLFGSVIAYRAKNLNKKVLVIDKRSHIGGNLYCENIIGIPVHKYGAHIFHTDNKEVWDFVNSLAEFNHFINSPIAFYKGKIYNLPFNMNTFYQMWDEAMTPLFAQEKINDQRAEILKLLNGKEPQNLEEQALSLVGKDIYEKLIKDYTEKQWGRKCTELPPSIIKRIPLRFTFDNNYFNDKYQGIPINGYNTLITKLLDGCDIKLNTDYLSDRNELNNIANKIVYTGPIDAYFNYSLGYLQYRTVKFKTEIFNIPNYQGNAVINFTDKNIPYTRSIEHKHFNFFGNDIYINPQTVISKEYSVEWKPNMEPYYPINDKINTNLYNQYFQMTQKEQNVIFGGRLAEYKYYDMDDIIEKALKIKL